MNIQDFLPEKVPTSSSVEIWDSLIDLRQKTFTGFLTVEANNGFLRPKVSLATSHGQEMVRILCFRVLEELAEAYDSNDREHYLEELIDAFNYLLSLFLLEGEIPSGLSEKLHQMTEKYLDPDQETVKLTLALMGNATLQLGSKLGDTLRNRAWMNHAQNTFFDGQLTELLKPVIALILSLFPDFATFYSMYVAKDSVLQFRLKSRY